MLDLETDPAIVALVEEARAEVEGGNYDRADALLARAEEADLAAARMAEKLAQQATEAASGGSSWQPLAVPSAVS